MDLNMNTELALEIIIGKEYTQEEKREAISWVIKAYNRGNADATYLLACLLRDKILSLQDKTVNVDEHTMHLMQRASYGGSVQARAHLNHICIKRYAEKFGDNPPPAKNKKGLIGFDGKPIRIKRTGLFTPVDAVLENRDGENVLKLTVPLRFIDPGIENVDRYCEAIEAGIMEWAGEYRVFGGQKLKVEIEICDAPGRFDTVYVYAWGKAQKAEALASLESFKSHKRIRTAIQNLKNNRSYTFMGIRWKTTSRKCIFMQSEDGRFDDYEELQAVAKHEFGHVLGLGDLYECAQDEFDGVEKGHFPELDCYYITDKIYNMVMCDHLGDVTNNDIEMVILAFQKNKIQLFQRMGRFKKISEALGRGN